MSAPDPRFYDSSAPLGARSACLLVGASAVGEGDPAITHVADLSAATEGAACFTERAALLRGAGQPSLLFVRPEDEEAARSACPSALLGVTERPRTAFARFAARLHASRLDLSPPLAGVADDAVLAGSATVAPSAVIGPGALVHDDVVVGPFALVGPGVVIGAGTVIGPHATLTHAIVGEGCRFSAGVRVGEAGFGYAPGEGEAVPVPQLGRVVIGDRVDLGANSCVDRGALGDTVIGTGTKIDNLCQVAHNCRIGANVLIASQTGISGSCTVGDGAMIGGQAGMADHVEIGAGAEVTAKAGLMRDVPPGERWGGVPARPARQWMKETAALARLASGKGNR